MVLIMVHSVIARSYPLPGATNVFLWRLEEEQDDTEYQEQEPSLDEDHIKNIGIKETNYYRREKNSQTYKHKPDGKIRFLKVEY